jgi:hypothetical protein
MGNSLTTLSARLMIPTTRPCRMTGKCLMLLCFMRLTISSSRVSSVIVIGVGVIRSATFRPWVWTHSSAVRPGPIKNSLRRALLRCVPVSARRRKSPSATMPTSVPWRSTTGNPLTRFCSRGASPNEAIRAFALIAAQHLCTPILSRWSAVICRNAPATRATLQNTTGSGPRRHPRSSASRSKPRISMH